MLFFPSKETCFVFVYTPLPPCCVCRFVCLHIQAQVSAHELGEVDILCRPEMRDPPLVLHKPPALSVYPLGWLVSLAANHRCSCHLLHFMCLLYSLLSAANTFLSVSSLFYLQIPPCHHKKVRQLSIIHLWIPVHSQMGAMWLRFCACSLFWGG